MIEKLTEDKLDNIRSYLIDNIYRNPDIMFSDAIRGNDDSENYIDLIEIITDLYELLHQLIEGEEYDYMFHWANKIGACVETGNFLKLVEGED